MSRRHTPPELRRRTWTEGTVWELLVAADILPYRLASPWADLGMSRRQQRQLREEKELLQSTHIGYILSQNGSHRRPSQPWLYVRPQRSGIYRLNDAGQIDRYGAQTQRLGSGSITEHGWYPPSMRNVRWLNVISSGLMMRRARQAVEIQPLPAEPQLSLWSDDELECGGGETG